MQKYLMRNILNCNFCYFQLTLADSSHSGPLPQNNGVPGAQVVLIEQLKQEMLEQIQAQSKKYEQQIEEIKSKYDYIKSVYHNIKFNIMMFEVHMIISKYIKYDNMKHKYVDIKSQYDDMTNKYDITCLYGMILK